LLSDISATSFEQFDIGQAKHIIHCNSAGKIINEGIVTRHGEDHFVTYGQGSYYADYKLRNGNYNATSREDDWYNYQVQGPKALYVMEKACGESIRDIRFMRFRTIRIAGHDVIALRQGMTGEIGWELLGPRAEGQDVYDAILKAGHEFGIRRVGGRTAMINHLEACYPTVGKDYICAYHDDELAEFREELRALLPPLFTWHNKIAGSYESDDVRDWYRSPIELGWSKVVKFDHDFIGRKALEEEAANPKRTIVTLVWNADDVVEVYASLFQKDKTPYDYMELPFEPQWYMYADKVLKNGKLVGVTTARGYSYYFREMISLCPIDVEHSNPGNEVTIVWGNPGRPQKEIRATVAPAPYKEDRRRTDLSKL
jgi:vanillate/3-O-methylgallate O-demethylase